MKRILIALIPALVILFAFRSNPLPQFNIQGTVSDENGNPLANVSVIETAIGKGTSTNKSGFYQLSVSGKNAILQFSSVGYQVETISVNGKKVIDVRMKTSSPTLLQEVVLRGYSTPAPRSLTGSLSGRVSGLTLNGGGNPYISKRDVDDKNGADREGYSFIDEHSFRKVNDHPLSTFSIDVDAASYSNIRRFINQGQLPPAGAVRIEEMINYFQYTYPQPVTKDPFSINTEIAAAPWNDQHKLVLIGLQGEKIDPGNLPAANLVFLIDVSGSMQSANKLPLVKASMKLLVDQLRAQDQVSIVVYAGAAGLVLPPTDGNNKTRIREAIDQLEAGGSTAGGAGIKLAYKTAREHFIKQGNNRVILCTDGDFNVGESSDDAMERLIEEERKSGVFLTVLGYGMGNYQDSKMQKLADKGNGNHAYIDGINEAKKVLVNEFGGTLFTIAKDVKLQVEFNPSKVQAYRLIGYENRMLANEDFNDDLKDAGDMGSNHTVTALYEIIPVGVQSTFLKNVDSLKYSTKVEPLSKSVYADELLTVKFRYKKPDGETSKLIEHPVADKSVALSATSNNFRFAAAVAEFGMLLRNSAFKSKAAYSQVLALARDAKGEDREGYRKEFVSIVERADQLAKNHDALSRSNNK